MKKIKFILILLLFTTPAFSQDLFSQLTGEYSDKDGFSATRITNDMFDLYLRKKNIEKDSPVYETLKKLDNILVVSQIKSVADENNADQLSGIHAEILEHYKKADYTLFKTEKSMGEDVKVFLKKNNDKVTSLALVTASSISVNLIEMNGDIDLAGLGELSNALNVHGLENLYKINGGPIQFTGLPNLPSSYSNYFNSAEWLNKERMKALQERIEAQSQLSKEQKKKMEMAAEMMAKRQQDMAEKYRQMAEAYGRTPIFLSYPGDTTTVYYLNGKKVKVEDIRKIDPSTITTVNVNKEAKNGKNVVRINTEK